MEERPIGYYKARDLSDEIRRLIKEQEKAEALKLLRSFEKRRREAGLKTAEAVSKKRAELGEQRLKSLFDSERTRALEAMKGLGSGQLELIRAVFDGIRSREREKGESLIRELKSSGERLKDGLERDYTGQKEALAASYRAKLAERLLSEARRVDSSFKELKGARPARGGAPYTGGASALKTGAALTSVLGAIIRPKSAGARGGAARPSLSYYLR